MNDKPEMTLEYVPLKELKEWKGKSWKRDKVEKFIEDAGWGELFDSCPETKIRGLRG
jgi:hypothetical protein